MAGAVAVGLVFVSRRLAALAAVAALVMAFARVYIAAHYPADVAVGLALGAVVALVVYLVAHRLITSAVAALVDSDSRLRPLLTTSPPRRGDGGALSMSGLVDRLLAIQGPLLYALVAAVVFVEDALFVGFVVPGETAAVLGGVAASLGHALLPVMMVTVVAAAIVGDSVGYEVGRHLGPRLVSSRMAAQPSGEAGPGPGVPRPPGWCGGVPGPVRGVLPGGHARPGRDRRDALSPVSGVQRCRRDRLGCRGGAAGLPGRHLVCGRRTHRRARSGPRRRRPRHRRPGGVADPGPSGRAQPVRGRSDELDVRVPGCPAWGDDGNPAAVRRRVRHRLRRAQHRRQPRCRLARPGHPPVGPGRAVGPLRRRRGAAQAGLRVAGRPDRAPPGAARRASRLRRRLGRLRAGRQPRLAGGGPVRPGCRRRGVLPRGRRDDRPDRPGPPPGTGVRQLWSVEGPGLHPRPDAGRRPDQRRAATRCCSARSPSSP